MTAKPRCWSTSCSICSPRTAQPPARRTTGPSAARRALFERAQRYARERIADPDLTSASSRARNVCRARTLQRAFASARHRRHALASRRAPGALRGRAGRQPAARAGVAHIATGQRLSRRDRLLPQLQGAIRPHAGCMARVRRAADRRVRKRLRDAGIARVWDSRVFQTIANAHNSRYGCAMATRRSHAVRPRAAHVLLVDAGHRQPRSPAGPGAREFGLRVPEWRVLAVAVRAAALLDERAGRSRHHRSHDAHAHGRSHGKSRLGHAPERRHRSARDAAGPTASGERLFERIWPTVERLNHSGGRRPALRRRRHVAWTLERMKTIWIRGLRPTSGPHSEGVAHA